MSKDKNNSVSNQFYAEFLEVLVNGLTKLFLLIFSKLQDRLSSNFQGELRKVKTLKRFYKSKHIKIGDSDVLGFSLEKKKYVKYTDYQWDRHTLIPGASGLGKTTFLKLSLEGAAINDKVSVMIDPKGESEIIKPFKAIHRKHNREFFIFAEGYWGEGAVKINPFKDKDHTDAFSMFQSSFCNETDNPFYSEMQQSAVSEIISSLILQGKEVSLKTIYDNLLADYVSDAYKGMINRLGLIVKGPLGSKMTGEGCLSISDIINQGASVIICINTQRYGNYGRSLAKLFFNEMLKISAFRAIRGKNLSYAQRVNFIIDEAGSVIEQEVLELINKCRSSLIEVTTCVQSFNDFTRAFKTWNGERSLWECFSNYIILRQSGEDYIEQLALLAGTKETVKKTEQVNDGIKTGGASSREVDEFIVHPNLIRMLLQGQAIIVNKLQNDVPSVDILALRDLDHSGLYNIKGEELAIDGEVDYKLLAEKRLRKGQLNNIPKSVLPSLKDVGNNEPDDDSKKMKENEFFTGLKKGNSLFGDRSL